MTNAEIGNMLFGEDGPLYMVIRDFVLPNEYEGYKDVKFEAYDIIALNQKKVYSGGHIKYYMSSPKGGNSNVIIRSNDEVFNNLVRINFVD